SALRAPFIEDRLGRSFLETLDPPFEFLHLPAELRHLSAGRVRLAVGEIAGEDRVGPDEASPSDLDRTEDLGARHALGAVADLGEAVGEDAVEPSPARAPQRHAVQ